jgi:DNA-binding transcriptional LysR family regulator
MSVTHGEDVMNLVESMRMFVRVAELKSFRSAAKEFNLSNPSATRTIAALETRLDAQLLDRSTRSVKLTASGLNYLTMCRVWLEHLEHLEETVRRTEDEPSGSLRIVASSALPHSSLTSLVSAFRRRYPNVAVQLAVAEHDENLLDGSYDVAVAANIDVDDKGLTAHALWTSPLVCVATSQYLESHGTPQVPQDLRSHAYIALSTGTVNPPLLFLNAVGQREQVALTPAYTVNSATGVYAAVLANMGFSIVPACSIIEDELNGKLLRLVPEYNIDAPAAVALVVYRNSAQPTPAVRAFIAYARTDMAREAILRSDVCVKISETAFGEFRALG